MQLSKHFSLREAVRSDTAAKLGIINTPSMDDLATIKDTACQMEQVRMLLNNKPVIVSSWYRNEALNNAVGGVKNSAHRLGYAVDFTCPQYGTPTAICKALLESNLQFDQLIWEYGRWVHISFAPAMRGQVLHIDNNTNGYRLGLP